MFIAFLGGIVLGIIFFGGLYWTISLFDKVKYPAALMSISMIIRMAILLIGFYLLMNDNYMNLLLALVGVITVRIFMTFNLKKNSNQPISHKRKE